ncbi:4'-phosphopantetheinyl transferase superfamily protein [Streptomyces sp. P9(2023)]|uniref:4'-phosphopantetheinyl transferase superfamily protein n=1 Tax=Streptomyces sp. P9(2023) TaxID=3064394 RepID=UPI0028F427D5|nr:4'-phosphopantetheinyl transferase superfamily protein [Streptomyces sp. P9(2023)]MDT9692109.1 4'-phosphopantetheinyl transferase superfamily protein [Streptomyces sp. P9(2023)]
MKVALSAHPVPEGFKGTAFLPFTETERRVVGLSPEHQRPRCLARIWARKEAALRLAGPGALSLADQVNALPGGRGGEVLVPEPLPGGGHRLRGAYVVDLPDSGGEWVASAATSAPVRTVSMWRRETPVAECVMG